MTFKEAYASGKRFKRSHQTEWLRKEFADSAFFISRQDAIANDWEIEPESKKKIKLYAHLVNEFPVGYIIRFYTEDQKCYKKVPQFDCEIEE